MSGPPHFHLPTYYRNPEGWGPGSTIPNDFGAVPLQMFSKSDKIGKVADWYGVTYQDKRMQNKYSTQFAGQQYSYFHDEEDEEFQLVDTGKLPRPMYMRNVRRFQRGGRGGYRGGGFRGRGGGPPAPGTGGLTITMAEKAPGSGRQPQAKPRKQQARWRGGNFRNFRSNRGPMKSRAASVTVKPDWVVVEELDFPRLAKLSLSTVKELKDAHPPCGSLEHYNRRYEQVNPQAGVPLKQIRRQIPSVTTLEDPIIRGLSKSKAQVFATDSIVATLMACTRSSYSWDVVVHRVGDKLFLDKRANSDFDLLTVNETSPDPPVSEEGINAPRELAVEASYINQNFTQQALKLGDTERLTYKDSNPFLEEDVDEKDIPSMAYRYRSIDIGGNIEMVVRTEQHAVSAEGKILNIFTLNEWDPRASNSNVDWRSKLDTQHGAVMATEIKNNNFKLAKWAIQALLAGSDMIKLGFVSRKDFADSREHQIIGTSQMRPSELSQQMSLSLDQCWGIFRCIVDLCLKQPPGNYLIMKDPNKPLIRIYSTGDEQFLESDSESGSEESDIEEEEEKK